MNHLNKEDDYKKLLIDLKTKIRQSQIKASIAVNSELIQLYWELGNIIVEKQAQSKWGSGFIEQLSKDLRNEFPDMGGFSISNLRYCKTFYTFYACLAIREQVVREFQVVEFQNNTHYSCFDKIPWGHHVLILKKIKDPLEGQFYIQKTIENNWSRSVLQHQIESKLYKRQGKSLNNFVNTLPKPQSDLANELLKDPYHFDFLQLSEKHSEKELEKALTDQIMRFLLELGTGFSFVGKQYKLQVGKREYFVDLLFYHLQLRCFVVIELKVVEFEPEFIGKLNFYLNVIDDDQLKHISDEPTIGILICKSRDQIDVEYSLKGLKTPIGISEYELKNALQKSISAFQLPQI